MAKRRQAPLPATRDALATLGAQIAAGRRERGWTAVELAQRLGVSAQLVSRIEKGAPGTAVGTVLEAALLCGVPLYGDDPALLGDARQLAQARLALLPRRVRPTTVDVPDDF